jgi:hypothetical protein
MNQEGRFMNPNKLFLPVTLSAVLLESVVAAQKKAMERLGQVRFPVFCTVAAQEQFAWSRRGAFFRPAAPLS